jgi:hypothetical protein
MMDVNKWVGETGFPLVISPKPFVPEPGTKPPVYEKVMITGTLDNDAGDSRIELQAVRLAPHSPIALRYLGERLSVAYAPPLALGHLRRGDRISVSAEFLGFPHAHLQQTDWRLGATCTGVFWLSRPAPP